MTVTRPDRIEDTAQLRALLREYYETILPRLAAVGGPSLSADALLADLEDGLPAYLPPEGTAVLAHDDRGRLVGCGFLRRIGAGGGELKRLYVMPEAQGRGLGRRLVQERIEAARRMGLTRLFTDTVGATCRCCRSMPPSAFARSPIICCLGDIHAVMKIIISYLN